MTKLTHTTLFTGNRYVTVARDEQHQTVWCWKRFHWKYDIDLILSIFVWNRVSFEYSVLELVIGEKKSHMVLWCKMVRRSSRSHTPTKRFRTDVSSRKSANCHNFFLSKWPVQERHIFSLPLFSQLAKLLGNVKKIKCKCLSWKHLATPARIQALHSNNHKQIQIKWPQMAQGKHWVGL